MRRRSHGPGRTPRLALRRHPVRRGTHPRGRSLALRAGWADRDRRRGDRRQQRRRTRRRRKELPQPCPAARAVPRSGRGACSASADDPESSRGAQPLTPRRTINRHRSRSPFRASTKKRRRPHAPLARTSAFARRASVSDRVPLTPARDEVQVSAGAQSEPAPLLHPWKGSSDALAAVSMSRT